MPGFDGTGPQGFGSRTGGGFGYCPPGTGTAPVGYSGAYYGVGRGGYPWGGGRGRAWGGGRGFGWRTYPGAGLGPYYAPFPGAAYPPDPAAERSFLEQQTKVLQDELEAIRQRLGEIEKADQPPTEEA
ncbi:MAG: DUF5320 domain-containing protein [Candidatus Euphemobacter frigidus]|nr:DUF5320 domain-containing protein [Candidatus Euphemobacter frigidus]MDP8275350.1 DUF5320 domain-containing protein [Candidatus Euphemobacter frigidus]